MKVAWRFGDATTQMLRLKLDGKWNCGPKPLEELLEMLAVFAEGLKPGQLE